CHSGRSGDNYRDRSDTRCSPRRGGAATQVIRLTHSIECLNSRGERRAMGTAAVRSVRRQVAADTRGEEARQRLIQTAIEVFGAYGFDGASTRMLAQKAAVNLAAIPYYFGGKQGLYRAAAQFIVDRI